MLFPNRDSIPTYEPEFFFALEILESIASSMSQVPPVVLKSFAKLLRAFKDFFAIAPRKAQLKIISLIR